MSQPLAHRLAAFTMATIVTFGLFAGINHLAGSEPASPQWAAASVAPRV